jgi:hypothetical protein
MNAGRIDNRNLQVKFCRHADDLIPLHKKIYDTLLAAPFDLNQEVGRGERPSGREKILFLSS